MSQPEADLYLVLVLPTGNFYSLNQNLAFGQANELLPLARNWQIQEVPLTPLFSFSVPETMTVGTYQWWLVLVRAGADMSQSANWLGSTHVSWEVRTPSAAVEEVSSTKARNQNPPATTIQLEELVAGNSAFAFNLYRQLSRQPGNLFFSPYSISLALAMAGAGAKDNTATQMEASLGFSSCRNVAPVFDALDLELGSRGAGVDESKGEKFQLSVVNSLWGQRGFTFLDDFLDRLSEYYGAGMRLVDFAGETKIARQAINRWVEEQTAEKIRDLIPAGGLQPDTRLVLTNAVYFKAGWLHPFDDMLTSDRAFHLSAGGEEMVPMMSETENFRYLAGNGYQAVELPYYGEELAMLVILPDAGRLASVEQMLTVAEIEAMTAGMKLENIQLTLPKFRFTWGTRSVKQALEDLGIMDAFDPFQADFSGMDGRRDLFIGDVLHQAFVAVDEKGTEAAAATAVTMVATGGTPLPSRELQVDRPFIFLVRDVKTGTVLFIGRVEDVVA
jgi:serpin B